MSSESISILCHTGDTRRNSPEHITIKCYDIARLRRLAWRWSRHIAREKPLINSDALIRGNAYSKLESIYKNIEIFWRSNLKTNKFLIVIWKRRNHFCFSRHYSRRNDRKKIDLSFTGVIFFYKSRIDDDLSLQYLQCVLFLLYFSRHGSDHLCYFRFEILLNYESLLIAYLCESIGSSLCL